MAEVADIEIIRTEGGTPAPMPAWVRCQGCDDYWCTIHYLHVYDCDCPPLEEWVEADTDPYSVGGRSPWPEDA